MEQITKKTSGITWVGILFMIYITAWRCYTGENIQLLLYGGYAVVCSFALIKILFSGYGSSIIVTKYSMRLLLFAIFCIFSILWAIEPSIAMKQSFFVFSCVVLVIIMSNYFIRLGSIDILHITIIVIGIAVAAVVIINEGGLGAFYESATRSAEMEMRYGERVGGELLNANTIGLSCGYSAVILFSYAVFYGKKYCYAIMIFPILVLIASASRKAILLLVAGFLLVVYFRQRKQLNIQKYLKILLGFVAVLILLRMILSLDIFYTINKRMEGLLSFFSEDSASKADNSTSIRMEMIQIGLKQFLFKPFWGIGIGNSQILNMVKLNFATYSHNDYIEHLVNGGIVGFVLYYSTFYMMIKDYLKFIKIDNDPKLIISFIIMILVLVLNMGAVTYYVEITTYVYFVLWVAQLEIKKRELNSQNNL